MAKTDDTRVIQQVVGGDVNAFAYLLERYEAKVYGLVVRLVGNEAEAEDLVQETFVQAYTHLSDYREEADFGSWLYRIAYNAALVHLRRRRTEALPIDEQLADSITDEEADRTLNEATETRIAQLEEALTHLAPDDRTAITLFYLEERSTREIAYVLGTTVTNVTTRLYRVRKRLSLLIKNAQSKQ